MNQMLKFLQLFVCRLLFGPEPFRMAGTTRSFQYQVWLATHRGRLGVRPFYPGARRIRVEPAHIRGRLLFARKLYSLLTRDDGWRQPGDGGQVRFSEVVESDEQFQLSMGQAIRALTDGVRRVRYNSEMPDIKTLIAEVLAGPDITPAEVGEPEEVETDDSVIN